MCVHFNAEPPPCMGTRRSGPFPGFIDAHQKAKQEKMHWAGKGERGVWCLLGEAKGGLHKQVVGLHNQKQRNDFN